ncbi:odorant receptor 141 [Nasonia vitripennis]|uniref:Odorant receptor n=1 Tax=Nasonia vitripennis TaxID=7425 RepID=A0A7M6UM35_NASVI|nr:odorant receptor 141 [Nasonia vitripennis]
MDIYDTYVLNINKKLLSFVGIWPYEEKKKNKFTRVFYLITMFCIIVPQMIGFYQHFGVDIDELLENTGTIFFTLSIYTKLFTSIIFENKLKILYDSVAKNWKNITEKHEREILVKYSERGRMLTLGYITYNFAAVIVYTTMPLMPFLLDIILPLNESRPSMFILNGQFYVDKHEHYKKLYAFDCLCIFVIVPAALAVDTMYVACTEHCLGLFAIIKYRLAMSDKFISTRDIYLTEEKDSSYRWMIHTIRMHIDILKFANILDKSYSSSFVILMLINTVYVSVLCVLVLISLDKPLNLIRYYMLLVAICIHLFYLSWPGQKLIDHSEGLFRDAYNNQWYEGSAKSKTLLKILTLRCVEPCLITAGGLVTMNFATYLTIMKKSVSFITVFSSFR